MNTNKKTLAQSSGFTLIEMMIVIALIAILGLMAIPSYQDRIIRQQIQDALPLADIAKTRIAAGWLATQTFPADNAAAELPAADKIVNNYIDSIAVIDGAVNIKFGNRAMDHIKGKILTMRPAVVEDAPIVPVTWVCGKADAPNKMTVKGVDQTNISAIYLPLACRKLPKN